MKPMLHYTKSMNPNKHSLPPIAWSAQLNVLSQRFAQHIAAVDGRGNSLSYAELNQRAHALAAHLHERGIREGEPVGTLVPNSIDAVWVSYGVRLSGACETPLSWGYTTDELQWCTHLASVKTVVSLEQRGDELQKLGLTCVPTQRIAVSNPLTPEAFPPCSANASARILFTSGTTGKPKGVLYTQQARWAGEQLLKASLPFIPSPGQKVLLMTPFVHGASLLTFAWLDHGATIVLHDGVDIEKIKPLLDTNALDAIFAPPTVLAKITSALAGSTYTSVRCVFTGTQPLTPALYKRACAMFGPKVRITYGKSECINPITVLDPEATHDYLTADNIPAGACVGWPASGVEIKVQEALSEEEPHGEILLRAPHMSAGLIDANGFRPHQPDGWHSTGDLGYVDSAGRLILTGRVADVIKTGGYRVNPDEIEVELAANTLCSQICVTSLASDYWGEIITAVAEGAQDGWQEQCLQLLESMSKHKRPRLFAALEALPRNPQGKISRKQVSRVVLETHALQDGPYPTLTSR
jgi:acyl-CoA synthetase (AMP-forming)/AMP-acid ligase II